MPAQPLGTCCPTAPWSSLARPRSSYHPGLVETGTRSNESNSARLTLSLERWASASSRRSQISVFSGLEQYHVSQAHGASAGAASHLSQRVSIWAAGTRSAYSGQRSLRSRHASQSSSVGVPGSKRRCPPQRSHRPSSSRTFSAIRRSHDSRSSCGARSCSLGRRTLICRCCARVMRRHEFFAIKAYKHG